jgi:hypothetical protein
MKKYLLVFLMMLSLMPMQMGAASQNRHKQSVSVTLNGKKAAVTVNKDSANVGIDAYSDTADVDTADYDDDSGVYDDGPTSNDEKFALKVLDKVFGSTSFGILAGLSIILVILLIILPIILIIVFLRYLFRRHNDRVDLERQAVAAGQPLKQPAPAKMMLTNEMLWQKGVRNVAIGIGLIFFFWILPAYPLCGIGFLVACLGGGQIVIARHSEKTSRMDFNNNGNGANNYQQGSNNNNGNGANNYQQSPNNNMNEPKNDNQTADTREQN